MSRLIVTDCALQEEGRTLAGAIEEWTDKARDKTLIDYGFHVAITLVYRDGEVVGERGSGRFIERSLAAPGLEVRV